MIESSQLDASKVSCVGCGCVLNNVFSPSTYEEVSELSDRYGVEISILGNLTNTLAVSDNGRVYVRSDRLKGYYIEGEYLYASAGESMAKLASYARKNSLSGFEALGSIPGTIGGAISDNSGCYGCEIGDILTNAYVFDLKRRKLEELSREEIGFRYRATSLMPTDLIIGAKIRLEKSDLAYIDSKTCEIRQKRKSQPMGKSLGSVFKRCDGVSAGYYIEKLGLKGYCLNGIKISDIHANFFINEGGDAESYLELMKMCENRAKEELGIRLEREVKVIARQNG